MAAEGVGGHGTDVTGAPGTMLHTNTGVSVHLGGARLGRATRGLPFGSVLRALTGENSISTSWAAFKLCPVQIAQGQKTA